MESINNTASTNKETFHFTKQQSVYHGKVRDVYNIDDKYLVMVVSDRISAFDVILPRPIPYKGQVLNQVAAYFLEATKDIVPNWVIAVPEANVTVGLKCNPIKIEMVVRGYLAGHAARTYASGKRTLCGVALPEGMKENDKFPHPIITPTTKAAAGHDEDISRDDIIDRKLVGRKDYELLEQYTLQLYLRGAEMAAKKGLILVDTKYEFGKIGDTIYLMDEIHTPDSSRYFYAEGYEERQLKGEAQKQLSKEFLRQWLINNGFQGLEGQQIPLMTDEIVNEVSQRYIELFEKVTSKEFVPSDYTNHPDRTEIRVNELINKLIQ